MNRYYTQELISDLALEFDTPLYVYDQATIERQIQKMKQLVDMPNVSINYATKANSNLSILKIMHEHNLKVDATGSGEVYLNVQAGFTNEDIYVVGNNFNYNELKYLVKENVPISIDALEQIDLLQAVAPAYQKVMLRVNPSFGAGENASIITGGDKHKFGIDISDLADALDKVKNNQMKLIGVNQHIGSLNLNYKTIVAAVNELLNIIQEFDLTDLELINFGGGFGINYLRRHYHEELNFAKMNKELTDILEKFYTNYPNKKLKFEFEPGRFLVAEAGILIGRVTSIKKRGATTYVGTDLGFSNFIRPTLYDSYHELDFVTSNQEISKCNVVGNMCESGDFIAKDRELIVPNVGDLVVVYDVGAYGFSMSSNYNNKLKPAELLIDKQQEIKLIRERETLADLLRGLK